MTFILRIFARSDNEVYEKGEGTLCETYLNRDASD